MFNIMTAYTANRPTAAQMCYLSNRFIIIIIIIIITSSSNHFYLTFLDF